MHVPLGYIVYYVLLAIVQRSGCNALLARLEEVVFMKWSLFCQRRLLGHRVKARVVAPDPRELSFRRISDSISGQVYYTYSIPIRVTYRFRTSIDTNEYSHSLHDYCAIR